MHINPAAEASAVWVKASKSSGSGQCVEMARTPEYVMVRHSKDPQGPVLRFTFAEFAAWLDGARKHEFDNLTQE